MTPLAALRRFVRLFDAGKFFEAHEALEDSWREAKRAGRPGEADFLKGLIHMAVAFVHAERNNSHGAIVKARSALALLESNKPFPGSKRATARFVSLLRATLAEFERGNLTVPRPLPAKRPAARGTPRRLAPATRRRT